MARGRVRRHFHCCVVGARRRRRDRSFRDAGPPTALFLTNNAVDGRRCCRCIALAWMAADPPALVLPWLQLLHALSFGATHLGALMFLAHNAPAGQAATAQG